MCSWSFCHEKLVQILVIHEILSHHWRCWHRSMSRLSFRWVFQARLLLSVITRIILSQEKRLSTRLMCWSTRLYCRHPKFVSLPSQWTFSWGIPTQLTWIHSAMSYWRSFIPISHEISKFFSVIAILIIWSHWLYTMINYSSLFSLMFCFLLFVSQAQNQI